MVEQTFLVVLIKIHTWADRDYTKLFQDNQTSFYDSTDRTFFITGVQFEIGKATPFEHRSFGEELALCQRYFCQTYPHGILN